MSDTILKASDASTLAIGKVTTDDKLTIPKDEDIEAAIKNTPLAQLLGRVGDGPLTWPPPPNKEQGYVNRGSLLSFDVIFRLDYIFFTKPNTLLLVRTWVSKQGVSSSTFLMLLC
jgi:hypothetical protein